MHWVSRKLRPIGEPRCMTKLPYGAGLLLSFHQERKACRNDNLPMRRKNTKIFCPNFSQGL